MGSVWAAANITGEINSVCVSVGWKEYGCWVGALAQSSWRGQGEWPNQTVKKVYKLYWSTYTHAYTPVDRRKHLATGSQRLGEGMAVCDVALPRSPMYREGLRSRPRLSG